MGLDPASFRFSLLRLFDPSNPTRNTDAAESQVTDALDSLHHRLTGTESSADARAADVVEAEVRTLAPVHTWVSEAGARITVLLGAGASVPAGLPTSSDLTRTVISFLDERSRAPEAWKFVRDRMDTEAMDVERLYRTIDDLRRLLRPTELAHLIAAPPAVGSEALADVLFDILDCTVATLRERSARADVNYLSTLVQTKLAGIVTLNFDTLVETAALKCRAPVSTGVDDWDGGFRWPISGSATPLLKLHGSLNWHNELRKTTPIPVGGLRTLARDEEYALGGGGIFSDLRFGVENKLSQAGPTPALLDAFVSLLEQTDLVITVGYSFRDDHVDVVLNRWAALNDQRRLILVDPARDPDDLHALEQSGSHWFRQMVAGLRHDSWPGRAERLCVLPESAEKAFELLLS